MQVKLKVLHGSKAGREVKVSVPEFIIGRGEGAHLRPRSDLISRHHCVIVVNESGVLIRDLKSRNGTFLNGEQIDGEQPLKVGDHVKVGKLEFEILIDHSLGGTKRPKVKDVKEAAARTASGKKEGTEDVSTWLEEADEAERTQRLSDPETRQFKLDETDKVTLEQAAEETMEDAETDTSEEKDKNKKKKKEYGKLPKVEKEATKDSCEAASDMLKNFFNRR